MCDTYQTRERERKWSSYNKNGMNQERERDKEMTSDIEIRIQHTDIFKSHCEDNEIERNKESGGGEDKQMCRMDNFKKKIPAN